MNELYMNFGMNELCMNFGMIILNQSIKKKKKKCRTMLHGYRQLYYSYENWRCL